MKERRWLSNKEATSLGITELNTIPPLRTKARYMITAEEWESVVISRNVPNKRKFVETIKKLDKYGNLVSTTEKLQAKPLQVPDNFEVIKVSTSKTTGQQWVQYAPKKIAEDVKDFDIKKIIKKYIKPIQLNKQDRIVGSKDFDRLILTDVHVGMDTDKYDNSMYAVKWDRDEIIASADYVVKTTLEERESDLIVIDDYGDLLDGFDGKTTRGGHDLPQNMTNEEAFDTALEFKLRTIEPLVQAYPNAIINNICNDNHSGAFGYFVNEALKQILNIKYPHITVNNHRKFINHYQVGRIAFAITHGKDDKSLKFGFKPQLKPDSIEKIDQYCKHNNLYKTSDLVIFCKGDSHQALLDMCSSDDFFYFNYPALSPSSQWVQNNFKKGRRGFFLETYRGLKPYIKPNFM
jgi:hypothetical protein